MDGSRFDDLTRRLAATLSRRGMLRLLGGSIAGTVFTSLMPERPARGQATPQGRPPPQGSIKQLLGEDLEDLQSLASRDANWRLLLRYASTKVGLHPGPSTAWVSDFVNLTRCVRFLQTILLTPAGEEAASLQWVTVERHGGRAITLAYLQDRAAFYSVTNGEVRRTSTDFARMPWPQIRQVCESTCQLVRDGKGGQAPCDVAVPLVELCVSKILDAMGLAQLVFDLTLAVKTVCTAMRMGCGLGVCVVCNPPCGPNQRCIESGSAGPLCCACEWDVGKCCVRPDGTVQTDGCCVVGSRCAWPAPPATAGAPLCAMFPNIQCGFDGMICTN